LLHRRPDLQTKDVRGNVDTRLRKLHEGQYDALLLAEAGLTRLGLERHISEVLPHEWMLPAIGQGALGIETRADDEKTRTALAVLDHLPTHQSVLAERSLLAALRGGCLAPVGAWGRVDGDGLLHLNAAVLSHDGVKRIAAAIVGEPDEAVELGRQLAQRLIADGASELIEEARGV
jgi:hydroxymethylbilane synthase